MTEEQDAPLGMKALQYAMEEMSFVHQQLAVTTWLCDQMYGLLKAMDEEPTEDNFPPWFAQVKEVIAMYDKLFPCCEDCEENGTSDHE